MEVRLPDAQNIRRLWLKIRQYRRGGNSLSYPSAYDSTEGESDGAGLLPPLAPTRPKGLMRWNPHGEYWEFTSPFETVDSCESTPAIRAAYLTRNYNAIFAAFQPGDIVCTANDITTCDMFVHMKLGTTQRMLPNGVYIVDLGTDGIILRPYTGTIDDYVALPHSVEQLPTDMAVFFNKRSSYDALGMRHKRGALVYGPPGNGKTFRIMKCAMEFAAQHDCLVFTLSNSIRTIDFLQYLTPVIHGRNNIVIIEEITERAQNDVQATLRFLDGDTSWNNSYIIATTNYPERLPANLIDRPGRFDILLDVGHPDIQSRRTYLEHFLGHVDNKTLQETTNYSIAYLREMIIRSKLDNTPFIDTIKMMRDRKEKIKNKFAAENGDMYGRYQ